MKRTVIGALIVVAGAAAFLLFGPSQVGGAVSYVVTSGDSMAPSLHDGDLVLVREQSSYEIGDVVAYRDKELGAVLLHRIIDVNGSRLVLQGDNNDFIDSFNPAPADLIGERWLLVPAGGKVLRALGTPEVAAAIAAILGFSISGAMTLRRRRRLAAAPGPTAKVRDEVVPPTERFRRSAPPLIVGLCLFLVLGILAFRKAPTTIASGELTYENSGRFAYRAVAGKGGGASVYEDGIVRTGDPIYRALVHRVRFTFGYDFETQATTSMGGTIAMEARLSSADGWARSIPVAAPVSFDGSAASVAGALDLDEVSRILSGVEKRTGFNPGLYNLDIVPRVAFDGSIEGEPVDGGFSPRLSFTLDATKLQLAQANVDVSEASAINPTEIGSIDIDGEEPAYLSLLGWQVEVRDARAVAVAGVAFFAMLLGLVGVLYLRSLRIENEALKILSRFRDRFVPVRSLSTLDELPAVEMTSIEGLIKMADAQERMVLYVPTEPIDLFVLEQGGVVYYYPTEDREKARPPIGIEEPEVPIHRPAPRDEIELEQLERNVEIDVR